MLTGSMPGVLGGVSKKVYKEVVKMPDEARIFVSVGNTENNSSLTQGQIAFR
jgi:hypothetical protein